MGGARGGTKSHSLFSQTALDDSIRVPGLKSLFLRKIQKSASESFDDLVYRTCSGIPHEYIASQGLIKFSNGSRIVLGGFNQEKDIDKYLGIEYDLMNVEELTQLTESKVTRLLGSLRSSKPSWIPRLYASTNPGGVGHHYIKEQFINPYRLGVDKKWLGGYTKFIPATYRDNKFLDDGYIQFLESLEGPLGQAWRDGNWDVFEGMAFTNFDHSRHVCEPFYIPEHWTKWRAVDWGLTDPFCTLWFAKEPGTGRIYVYRELYLSNLTDTQQAEMIRDLTPPNEQILLTYADPSLFGKKVHQSTASTTAVAYAKHGVPVVKGDNNRISGRRKVSRLLGNLADGLPGIMFFTNCPNLIRTLPALPVDDARPEDVDTHAEDHAYDALKYGLTNVYLKSDPVGPEDDYEFQKVSMSQYSIL